MRYALCFLLLGAMLLPGPSAANPDPIGNLLCAPTDQMRRKLETQFGAQRQGSGVRSPEQLMELWARPEDGEWTLVIAYASGTSCIVAMGEHWDQRTGEAG